MKEQIIEILEKNFYFQDGAIRIVTKGEIQKIASEIDVVIEEQMPDEFKRMKIEEAEVTKRKWAELDRKSTELLDKYFAEHTRKEIMADLGIKNTFIQKVKYFFHSRIIKNRQKT